MNKIILIEKKPYLVSNEEIQIGDEVRDMNNAELAQVASDQAEAQAQAICMMTNDFHRAYHAFVAKQTPIFEGD